jgi:ATP-citrate lyase beta-subunit
MAQLPLREYDAKRLLAAWSGSLYTWFLIESKEQIETIVPILTQSSQTMSWVVKPDQLFGKRGKYGLVGVNLDAQEVQDRLAAHWLQARMIEGVTDQLNTFLIEPFVSHDTEYYLSLSTERDADIIRFSASWGVDIEDDRSSVREVRVDVLEQLDDQTLGSLFGDDLGKDEHNPIISMFTKNLFQFFRTQWFVSLEVNPFVITAQGNIVCLDMVAKVDSCEAWRQDERTKYISRVKPFGTRTHPSEAYIASIDEKTWASLKLTILNPDWRFWFLLWGWGASVIVMDTMAKRGLLQQVGNYGELSGNPDEASNRAYVTTVVETMLANGLSDQYLCLVGWIANFTDILALVKPLVDVLKEYWSILVERRVTVLMRRGWLRVEQAMHLLQITCAELWIMCKIYDDNHYLTEVFADIKV